MTLAVAVTGPRSIWLLTDRRLSYLYKNHTEIAKEDARKLLLLETTDGVALLGYAGLGSTVRGTEPGDWMSRILRSRNLPLEESLAVLAEAVRSRLPRHLAILGTGSHNVIIPAFLRGAPRLYSIDVARRSSCNDYVFRVTSHVRVWQTKLGPVSVAPRLMIGGSGAHELTPRNTQTPMWARTLLRIVKAHDNGQVSSQVVAAHLAHLNYKVHLARERKL